MGATAAGTDVSAAFDWLARGIAAAGAEPWNGAGGDDFRASFTVGRAGGEATLFPRDWADLVSAATAATADDLVSAGAAASADYGGTAAVADCERESELCAGYGEAVDAGVFRGESAV